MCARAFVRACQHHSMEGRVRVETPPRRGGGLFGRMRRGGGNIWEGEGGKAGVRAPSALDSNFNPGLPECQVTGVSD